MYEGHPERGCSSGWSHCVAVKCLVHSGIRGSGSETYHLITISTLLSFGLFKGWELKFNYALLSSLPWGYQKEQPKLWSSTFKIIIMFYQNEVCYIWNKKFKDYKIIQNGDGKFQFQFFGNKLPFVIRYLPFCSRLGWLTVFRGINWEDVILFPDLCCCWQQGN